MFLGKGVLKICRKFTGQRPCQSFICAKCKHTYTSEKIKLFYNIIINGKLKCNSFYLLITDYDVDMQVLFVAKIKIKVTTYLFR